MPDFPCTPRERPGQAHSCPQLPTQITLPPRPSVCPCPNPPPSTEHLHQPHLVPLARLLANLSPPSHTPQLAADSRSQTPLWVTFPLKDPQWPLTCGSLSSSSPTRLLDSSLIWPLFPRVDSTALSLPLLAGSAPISSLPTTVPRCLPPPFSLSVYSHQHSATATKVNKISWHPLPPSKGSAFALAPSDLIICPRPYPISVSALPPSGRPSFLPSSLPFAQILNWTWKRRQTPQPA